MIRNERTDLDGTVEWAEVIDLDAGTVTVEEYDTPVSTRALLDAERAAYAPPADPVAALLAEAEAASTVAKLRAVLVKVLEVL